MKMIFNASPTLSKKSFDLGISPFFSIDELIIWTKIRDTGRSRSNTESDIISLCCSKRDIAHFGSRSAAWNINIGFSL